MLAPRSKWLAFSSSARRFFRRLVLAPNAGFDSPNGLSGIVSGASLAFFAFLGFEIVATSAEEVRDPKRTLPLAILLSLAVCGVLYVAVAIAFTTIMPYSQIAGVVAAGKGALAVAASRLGGPLVLLALSIIALFSTANTVLVSIFGASRMIYGMSEDGALPGFFKRTARSGAPWVSLLLTSAAATLLAFFSELSFVASATVAAMFVVFFLDNLAVIVLRFKHPRTQRGFRVPLNVKNVPLPTVAALALIAAIFLHEVSREPVLALGVAAIAAAGVLLFEGEERLAEIITHRRVRLGKHFIRF
ncbi:MAG: amino acid permease [Candidatus Norongarragalinales archaeon]